LLNRRELIVGTSALVTAPASRALTNRSAFVTRKDKYFSRLDQPYRVAGTNMWYAAYLGADAPIGNRDRLRRELDRLSLLGINNVRILGSSEFSPLKNSVRPTFRNRTSRYNQVLLHGLDYALTEMGKRRMTAVLYLANFWEWSGGMMTYLYWTNGGRYLNMNDPTHPWPEFADMSSEFYGHPSAVRMFEDYVRALVGRRNSITGQRYRDDPTIMGWQLANEPRPGGSGRAARNHMTAYLAWIDRSARLIKSIDPHHLVSTGSEGTQGCNDEDQCVFDAHRSASIDYVTAHIWPQNWGWADPKDLEGTWPTTERNARSYLSRQLRIARHLGKPLVIEEFGYPRDGGDFTPGSSTTFRDRYYELIFDTVIDSVRAGDSLQGANFWAWGGEGRAQHSDRRFVRGDTAYLGDPPHEPQGWYSVFDTDVSTKKVIKDYAQSLSSLA